MSKRHVPYRLRPATKDEDVREFIARVRQRSEQLGLTLTELARGLGCDHAAVSGWFSLRYKPAAHLILRMPEVLGVSGHWLLTGEGPMEVDGTEESDKAEYLRGAHMALSDIEDALKQVQGHWSLQAKRLLH